MLLLDSQGKVIAPGRHKVSRVFDADAGALPTGFTLGTAATEDTGMTSSWVAASAGVPGVVITSGTATGSASSTRRRAALTGSTFTTNGCAAVRLRAVVTGGQGSANVQPRIGWQGATSIGPMFLQQTNADYCRLFTNNGSTSANRKIPFKWIDGVRHDLTAWWTIDDGYCALAVDGGDAIQYADKFGTGLVGGSVYPVVSNTAVVNGATATLTVHRMEVDLYYWCRLTSPSSG